MNSIAVPLRPSAAGAPALSPALVFATDAPIRLALFGSGGVGQSLLQRLKRIAPDQVSIELCGVGNSRRSVVGSIDPRNALDRLDRADRASDPAAMIAALGDHGLRIIVDATPSEAIAQRHADWLARGIHVVTACKLGQGATLARWREIRAACVRGGTLYGDAATVGAGLPLLRSLRALRAGGDRVHAIAGVLSGSLGWLFARFDGTREFSDLVREAQARGYTEPDPCEDLSGADVERKLLILARSAGIELEAAQVATRSLLDDVLAELPAAPARDQLAGLDTALRARLQAAQEDNRVLRYVARVDADGARVGLEALRADDPLAQGEGCDNRVAIWSDRYAERPLVIQGPGAGVDVTAAALLDDILDIATRTRTSLRAIP